MPCCAIGPCGRKKAVLPDEGMVFVDGRWHCYICYILPKLFTQPVACGRPAIDKDPCVLVAHHPSWQACKSRKILSGREKAEDTSTRDGEAASKVRTELSQKKNRQGALYVPSDRRV
jgi:hypothetical protein